MALITPTEGGYVDRYQYWLAGLRLEALSRRVGERVGWGSETQEARAGGGSCHSSSYGVGASIVEVFAGNDVELVEPTVVLNVISDLRGQ